MWESLQYTTQLQEDVHVVGVEGVFAGVKVDYGV